MSTEYFDLVVVKMSCGKRLFKAPAWSYLSAGDEVRVNTRCGVDTGVVVDCITVNEESEKYRFVMNATNATLPLKTIVGKVVFNEFSYPVEEENNEQNS